MSIDAVKIPQNVQIEDRIIGSVSLRQIIIMLLSGAFSYGIWSMFSAAGYGNNIPLTVIAWSPAVIGAAFSFVKIQGISLLRFVLLLLERMEKPTVRHWTPRQGISINFKTIASKDEAAVSPVLETHSRQKFETLSAALDRGPAFSKTTRNAEESSLDLSELPEDSEETVKKDVPVPSRARSAVRRERISVDGAPEGGSVDTVRSPCPVKKDPATPKPLVRDISPPQS